MLNCLNILHYSKEMIFQFSRAFINASHMLFDQSVSNISQVKYDIYLYNLLSLFAKLVQSRSILVSAHSKFSLTG